MRKIARIRSAGILILFAVLGAFAFAPGARAVPYQAALITAQNTWTAPVLVVKHGTIRIAGTWSATVTLQRSEDGHIWYDTGDTFTTDGVYTFTDYTDRWYRVGVKTGGYTSGTIDLWLGGEE